MPISDAPKGWIFRACSQQVPTRDVTERLSRLLECPFASKALDALLTAGELECTLSDSGDPACEVAAKLTDCLALNFLRQHAQDHISPLVLLQRVRQSARLVSAEISVPEGFAYYALHPAQFASPIPQSISPGTAAIVGIRSIGTVLSAVSAAGLSLLGWRVSRITTRPQGHPYDRVAEFNAEQRRWIHSHRELQAEFLVVDEGPGLSGSSFLSVAEALEHEGVPAHRITLVGTRQPDPETLYAREAAQRWKRFQFRCTSSGVYTDRLGEPWGSGRWRNELFDSETHWPASWLQMERLKFRAADASHLLKFDGFGCFGSQVRDRASQLAQAGFGPGASDAGEGLTRYEFVRGTPCMQRDMSAEVLETIASYCAFRACAFRCSSRRTDSLVQMARFNFQEEFGTDPELRDDSFATRSPVIVDGRMQPHEWVRAANGRVFKVDGCTHGDDHFFPGPTDIAWDLAGTIVEWDLKKEQASSLLARYQKLTGDNPERRIRDFLIAYASFRLAYCKMASVAVGDSQEQVRLRQAQQRYRVRLEQQLQPGVSVLTPSR